MGRPEDSDEGDGASEWQTQLLVASLVVGAVGAAYATRKPPRRSPTQELLGKTVVITGATSGIGRSAAEELAMKGADLVLGCRDIHRGGQTCEAIRAAVGGDSSGGRCEALPLDLADLATVQAFGDHLGKERRVDVLINNAGAMYAEDDRPAPPHALHMQQALQWDQSMVVNHLGAFLLTETLLPNLRLGACASKEPSRIVNVGSRLEKSAKLVCPLELSDKAHTHGWMLASPAPYSTMQAYANSKLCLTSSTFETARRLQQQGDTVNCNVVTPGMVHTNLSRFKPAWRGYLSWPLRKALLRSPGQGAEVVVWAASAPDLKNATGKYFGDCKEIEASLPAQDPAMARDIYTATTAVLQRWLR